MVWCYPCRPRPYRTVLHCMQLFCPLYLSMANLYRIGYLAHWRYEPRSQDRCGELLLHLPCIPCHDPVLRNWICLEANPPSARTRDRSRHWSQELAHSRGNARVPRRPKNGSHAHPHLPYALHELTELCFHIPLYASFRV